DIPNARRNSDGQSGDPGAHVRRLITRMDLREWARQQTVTRHRKPDARLSVLKDQKRREHSDNRAYTHPAADAVKPKLLERSGHGRGIVQRFIVGDAG